MSLEQLAERLFPIPRSITGPGIVESAEILKEFLPLEETCIPSGTPLFDWEAPPEWTLHRARLLDERGKTLIDSHENNLHVMNFSEPFSGTLSVDELQDHLYSLPDLPEAIPYVTSYYERRWGLCVSDAFRNTLTDEKYRVEIETSIKPGQLRYWTAELPATRATSGTFLISSYLCHPSLANNELSGPLAMVHLYKLLAASDRSVNFLFLIAPETIGSLGFLHSQTEHLLSDVVGGLVLTCLGGPERRVSLKLSRRDWLGEPSSLDLLCREFASLDSERFEVREFDPAGGSDERQFCSPGFNLPVAQAARTLYGQYPGYHNSFDTLEFMDSNQVQKSAEQIYEILSAFQEREKTPASTVQLGEPFLSKRSLYPSLNFVGNNLPVDNVALRMRILSLCDGSLTVKQIWQKLESRPHLVCVELDRLKESGLVTFKTNGIEN